jgi:hypothetical protein
MGNQRPSPPTRQLRKSYRSSDWQANTANMASPTTSQPPIPYFYRLFFTTIDPFIALSGAYMNIATPADALEAYVPPSISNYNPATFILFRIMGGDLLGVCFLCVVLLRYTNDIGVWKILEGAILTIDLVMLQGLWEMLGRQGRRYVGEGGLRGMDWLTLGITVGVAAVRSAFLLGIGFGKVDKAGRRA